jgi:erythrocyte band 7 integral membrane protein
MIKINCLFDSFYLKPIILCFIIYIILKNDIGKTTDGWGVKVERVEIKDVKLPDQMQRLMAQEPEASREAKAKVIAAEGEAKAAIALKNAADIIAKSPTALQLRYLQTLADISAEKNSTIVFPVSFSY